MQSITKFSKFYFCYINNIAFSHQHIYKILNILQFGKYLDLSKAQKLLIYKAALAFPKSAYWIKIIQSEYDFFIENEIWDFTELPLDQKVLIS